MKRKRFTEAQIAFALRQAESGTPVAEIIRKMGISEVTFYRWKKKYAGLGVAELRRFKSRVAHRSVIYSCPPNNIHLDILLGIAYCMHVRL
jgi:transposase-like protein